MSMRGGALRPSMIARMLVCVDHRGDRDISGRIFNPYLPRPIRFRSYNEMLFRMEDFFDRVSFPYAHYQHRVFRPKSKKSTSKKKESGVRKYMAEELFVNESGEKATFIVHVKFRQNATWQGSVTWTEGEKTENFRSVLEMLRLMDSALDSGDRDMSSLDGDPLF